MIEELVFSLLEKLVARTIKNNKGKEVRLSCRCSVKYGKKKMTTAESTKNYQTIYSLILGQCSSLLVTTIGEAPSIAEIEVSKYILGLGELI